MPDGGDLPSNPFISIDPILAVPGMRAAITACRAPVVAVSPIIGSRAVKGPTAKMMAELGMPASAQAVAEQLRPAGRLRPGRGRRRRGRSRWSAVSRHAHSMASEDDKRARLPRSLAARGLGARTR